MGTTSQSRVQLVINDTEVSISNPTKLLWPTITKKDYLHYLIKVSPFLLPFLKERLLTVIRYPNGVNKEAFYQKNCPDYAPSYVRTHTVDDINFIICSDLQTLLWLGNQGAIEFHIPFQRYNEKGPSEIVLDLDPPSRTDFKLALDAALILKEVFKNLKISSFIKTSGNKGMQIYIPLEKNAFTYEQTRTFTSFIAQYLIKKEPTKFTTERLKKKRDNRLYIDFIQHAEGKTIIAPYSIRGNEDALVSTPLHWDEVCYEVKPENYSMADVISRIDNDDLLSLDMEKMRTNNNKLKQLIDTINKSTN